MTTTHTPQTTKQTVDLLAASIGVKPPIVANAVRLIDLPDGLHTRNQVPSAMYHARELGLVSNSALKEFAKTPAHLRAWAEAVEGDGESEKAAFRIGRATHTSILEPDLFTKQYVAKPEFGDCRKTLNKDRRDEWVKEHKNFEILSESEYRMIRGMRDSVRLHPLASKLVTGGESELTGLWTDSMTGLRCKVRADHYNARRDLIVDLKTTGDASPRAFGRDVIKYFYHHAHALYRAGFAALGVPARHFIFVVVEKAPPYAVALYQLDELGIRVAHDRIRTLMCLLADCVRRNEWPSYSEKIQTLITPEWVAAAS